MSLRIGQRILLVPIMTQRFNLYMRKPLFSFGGSALMLFLAMQVVYGVPAPMNYVFIAFAAAMTGLSIGDGFKINYRCVALLVIAALSIWNNDIPSFFKPMQRFALFLACMIGCSPLINGGYLNKLRRQITMGALWAMGGITVWSFIGRFTGQGSYIWGIVNGYQGVTSHPNFLGFFVMIAMVWFAALFFRSTKTSESVLFAGLWLASLTVILMSASRTSAACALLGTLAVVYLRLRKDAGKMLSFYAIMLGLAIFAWPVIAPYTEAMQKKTIDLSDSDSMVAASRGTIWQLRYSEIEESPWLGVGAYSCDINLPYAHVFYNEYNGSLELGSSYLGMLSQCGWLGFLAFMSIIVPIGWKAWKYATEQRTPYAQLMFPLCFAIAVHMAFEGYAMTAGAVQCVVLWLILAGADQCDIVADYPVAWEDDEDPITPEEYVRWRDEHGK